MRKQLTLLSVLVVGVFVLGLVFSVANYTFGNNDGAYTVEVAALPAGADAFEDGFVTPASCSVWSDCATVGGKDNDICQGGYIEIAHIEWGGACSFTCWDGTVLDSPTESCPPQPSQCSDGIHNDSDGRLDVDDPGCHTDFDPWDGDASYNPDDDNEGDEPQCVDNGDNDSDGRKDSADPGCHTDYDPGNADSYVPADGSESGEPQCIDNKDNDDDGKIDEADPACHLDGDENNSSSYLLIIPSEDDVNIDATPVIIRSGDFSTIVWEAGGTPDSCSVSGPGISTTTTSGTEDTSALTEESTYTITCNYSGYERTDIARVIILPSFEEF